MNRTAKIVLGVAIAILLALASGWIWGSSGRRAAEARLDEMQVRLELTEARAFVNEARVDLYNLNFGTATRNLEAAKMPLNGLATRLERMDRAEDAGRVRQALARVEEAQRLAGQLNPTANARAGEAVALLSGLKN